MDWKLVHTDTGSTLPSTHESMSDALAHLASMGDAFSSLYEAVPITTDKKLARILTEGLVAGDLRHIVLPQISVDEYLPSDTKTDNVVLGLFITGVPEAVIPLRDFLTHCKGVEDVAYSDSDTQANTSIIYVEMARNIKISNISDMMTQLSLLTDLDVNDFSMIFPSSSKRYPYSIDLLSKYFDKRTKKQNWDAQQKAIQDMDK